MSKKIILKGYSEDLKPIITHLLAMNQMLENLDLDSNPFINENFDPGRRYHPLVRLVFREDTDFVAGKNQPKGRGQNRTKGEIRFRLMDETTETISKSNLTTLGEKVKEIFGANNGYIWNKGKEVYCYADWSRGYQLQILARSETHAKDVVTKILSLQNHSPQWKYLNKVKNSAESERYPNTPDKKTILGEQVTLPLRRPNANVRFKFADVRISPLTYPVVIYDMTRKKVGALVR